MVPIAPFAIFGSVYQASGGMPVLAYLVGMVALLFTASSYAQMVRAFPLSGSVYNYAGRGIGAPVGFLTGWAILLDYTLVPGLLYLVAAVAMNSTLPQVPVWAWLVGFVALNTVINLRGIRMSMTFTKIMIVAELGVLALYLSVGDRPRAGARVQPVAAVQRAYVLLAGRLRRGLRRRAQLPGLRRTNLAHAVRQGATGRARIIHADATRLPTQVPTALRGTVDLVLTSAPMGKTMPAYRRGHQIGGPSPARPRLGRVSP